MSLASVAGDAVNVIFNAVRRARKANTEAIALDARDWAIEVGKAELGQPHRKIDPEHVALVVDSADMNEDKFRKLVDAYKRRSAWAALAPKEKELQAAAHKLELERNAFDREESERHRAALRKLAAMDEQLRIAIDAAGRATEARGNLVASAPTTEEERTLTLELTGHYIGDVRDDRKVEGLLDRLAKIDDALNPNRGPGSLFAATMWEHPARMLADAERALKDMADPTRSVENSPERKAKLLETIAAAKRGIAAKQVERAELVKRIDAVNGRLAAIAAEKIKPEFLG